MLRPALHQPAGSGAETTLAPWVPRFACPECRVAVAADREGGAVCPVCGHRIELRDGIYRGLTPRRAEAAASFVRQYRLVREGEGRRAATAEEYRRLPDVARSDRHAIEWRLRRESWAHFQRWAMSAVGPPAARVIELGAGCGWLSHRLALLGHSAVAVDCLDDAADGLGACRHAPIPFMAVQADFDALPFEPGQFDLAAFAGSLHYAAEPAATLAEAARMLTPCGVIAVLDSPVFARDADGEAMVAAHLRSMAATHALERVTRAGRGFLTFMSVERACEAVGRRATFYKTRGPLTWRMRRAFAGPRLGRAPAAFGLWVAR